MKNAILLLLMLMSSTILFSQDVVVEYRQKRMIDQETLSDYPESIQKVLLKKSQWAPALLIQEGNKSVYFTDNRSIDSLTKELSKGEGIFKKQVSAGSNKFFKDFSKNESLKEVNMYQNALLIQDDLHQLQWQITSDTKTIKGILCHKATAIDDKGNSIEAWYDKQSKIKNGPQHFGGLPGLITQLKTATWEIELVSMRYDTGISLLEPNQNAKIMTLEEYREKYSKGETQIKRQ